ncbi:hypothetical protein C0991_001209 [Blastosporella zonata]|nr:hypothetical protein C0991_001209 [Blastosporella zonata]
MVETRAAKAKAKSSAPTKQRTLFDLLPKAAPVFDAPIQIVQTVQDEASSTPSVLSTSTEIRQAEEIFMAPVVEKLRQASLERRPLHPFFSKPAPLLPSRAPVEVQSPQDSIIEIVDEDPTSGAATDSNSVPLPPIGGSQEDPIVLDSSPLKPLRPSKASVSKPIAPLFAPRRLRPPLVTSTSQSPEVILLELPDQPARPRKLAPLFAPRPSKVAPASPSSRTSKAKEMDAPFPNKESQHVRGLQHNFSNPGLPYGHRAEHIGTSSTSYEPGSLQLLIEKTSPPSTVSEGSTSDPSSYLNTIPDGDRQHPAITRFATTSQAEGSSHRLWVDKWRPTHAAEILGNEENAIYLRDWIRALELQLETSEVPESETNINQKGKGKAKPDASRGTKRPRVVRAVEKRRGRKKQRIDDDDDDDDWIVYSADDVSSVASSSPPPFDGASSPSWSSPGPEIPSVPEPEPQPMSSARYTFDPLTNTILLAGPSGSGKTAAVYACAEEFGWDVLEVYPGIGRRNGAGIDSLIGDAGKNHHVPKTRAGNPAALGRSGVLDSLFTEGREATTHGPIGDEAAFSISGQSSNPTPSSVRQSLILLEEVDILFKEDNNFWPAVTNFIRDCRRPVICTCNDISLVPTQDLPLQTILIFQPCAPSLVVSYLQALCFTETRCVVQRDTLFRMYEDSAANIEAIDLPDIPNPATSGDLPAPDLRRTINNLQFICGSASGIELGSGWEPEAEGTASNMCDWDWSWENDPKNGENNVSADQDASVRTNAPPRDFVMASRHADCVSFVDTHLMRRAWDTQEGLGWGDCETSNDDEVGYSVLFGPRASRSWLGAGLYTRDIEMASAAMWLSRGALRPTSIGISPCRTRELFRARVHHQLEIGRGLDGIVPLGVMAVRRKEVHLDYATRVRDIMNAEDVAELIYMQRERSGRATRNSGDTKKQITLASAPARICLHVVSCNVHPVPLYQPMSHTSANGSASNEPSSRPSPPPLAPLQYLQNQRRGSVTDPSLHTASNIKLSTGFRPPGEQPSSASSGGSSTRPDARPQSPYVFGDATPHTSGGEMQIRNLLRSSPGPVMEVEAGFDYSMRRHSIAVGQDKGQGTKRKMGDEILAGPGVPREQGPAAKRRGSAIDTARIAQLSLNDRRNSVDSRSTDSRANWWLGDRRDSTSSILSYSSAFTGAESPQSRGIATFTWPAEMQNEPNREPTDEPANAPSPTSSARHKDSNTPYSRSPELRVSHKLAERKRRKEMKDLFDELRDQLPADRGMKASKWEILSKGIHQEMARQVDILRHELDAARQGLPFPPVFAQPPVSSSLPPPHPLTHSHPPPPLISHSRPPSTENITPPQTTLDSRMEPPPT